MKWESRLDILRREIRIAARVSISLRLQISYMRICPDEAAVCRCRERAAASMHRWRKWKRGRHGSRMKSFCFGMRTGYRSPHIHMNRPVIPPATEILLRGWRCNSRRLIIRFRISMIMMRILRSAPIRIWRRRLRMECHLATGLAVFL